MREDKTYASIIYLDFQLFYTYMESVKSLVACCVLFIMMIVAIFMFVVHVWMHIISIWLYDWVSNIFTNEFGRQPEDPHWRIPQQQDILLGESERVVVLLLVSRMGLNLRCISVSKVDAVTVISPGYGSICTLP